MPVLQLALGGTNLSEQQLNDYGLNFIRTQLITVPGASVPYPYGGKQRQVQMDLNTTALQSKGLAPLDVVNAISAQNLILPTGASKIGTREYDADIPNAAPQTIADLNRIPIKTIGSTTIYIKDVAWVRDGSPPPASLNCRESLRLSPRNRRKCPQSWVFHSETGLGESVLLELLGTLCGAFLRRVDWRSGLVIPIRRT